MKNLHSPCIELGMLTLGQKLSRPTVSFHGKLLCRIMSVQTTNAYERFVIKKLTKVDDSYSTVHVCILFSSSIETLDNEQTAYSHPLNQFRSYKFLYLTSNKNNTALKYQLYIRSSAEQSGQINKSSNLFVLTDARVQSRRTTQIVSCSFYKQLLKHLFYNVICMGISLISVVGFSDKLTTHTHAAQKAPCNTESE